MRILVLATLAALSACTQQPRHAAGRCDLTVTRQVAFTAADAEDVVTARSFGATCDEVIALYTIHDAGGRAIWAWASPLPRAFGEVFEADDDEHMQDFLERWAQPTTTTTQSAPEWARLLPGQATLDQLTYDDIRARDLPMLCHFSGTAREICVFWEPAAGGAGHFLDRDVEETSE